MERDEQKKSVIPVVTIIIAIAIMIILGGILNTRFHSRTMMIDTEYKVSDIRWGEGCATEAHAEEHPTGLHCFSHQAGYGYSFCNFNLQVEDVVIPIYFDAFKCNWWDYDSYRLKISKGDSDSEIVVQVYSDGNECKNLSAKYNIYEADRIEIGIGP